VGRRPYVLLRTTRVSRRLGARARRRTRALRPLSRLQRGPDGEGALDLGARLAEAGGADAATLVSNRNVLAALLEAAIAAAYLEYGFEAVEPAVVAAFEPRIEFALTSHVDHKTELQERLARAGRTVSYTTLNVDGPPHEREFTAAAIVDGEVLGTGVGRSKKDAEQAAAKETLLSLGISAPS
jgi:ribonuclease-3